MNTFLAKVFADLKKADALDAMVSYGLGVCQNKSTVVSVGVIIGARLVATGVYGRPVSSSRANKASTLCSIYTYVPSPTYMYPDWKEST